MQRGAQKVFVWGERGSVEAGRLEQVREGIEEWGGDKKPG